MKRLGGNMGDVLTFGKHKGKTVSETPMHYLDWLYGELEEEQREIETLMEMIEDRKGQG